MSTGQKSPNTKERRARRGKPPWWVRLLVVVLSPILFLGLVELVLSLIGYGYPRSFFIRVESLGTDGLPGQFPLQRALRPQAAFPNARAVRAGPQGRFDHSYLCPGQFRRVWRPGAGLRLLPAVGIAAQRTRRRQIVRGHQHGDDRHELPRCPAHRAGMRQTPARSVHRLDGQQRGGWPLWAAHAAQPALCQSPFHQRLHHGQEGNSRGTTAEEHQREPAGQGPARREMAGHGELPDEPDRRR